MSQPMQTCENCLKEFPESKIATHFGYCRRNIKKCKDCGEMYDINCQEEHEQEFHKKTPCQFCKKQFGVAELQKHKNGCSQRTKYCEYCQLNVPLNQYSIHLKACQSRTKQCDQCRKPIANKDYLVHLTTCKGITEEPKSYDQFINNQRTRDNRQEIRQQYGRVEQKKQADYRKQAEIRRRQVPASIPTYNIAPKPTVTQIQPSNYRQPGATNQPVTNQNSRQPVTTPTVIPSSSINTNLSSNSNKYGVVYQNNTYNPREVISNGQQVKDHKREQPREQPKQYIRQQPKQYTREQVSREQVSRDQYGKYGGGYGVSQQPVSNMRNQVKGDIRSDNRGGYEVRRQQNVYSGLVKQPEKKQAIIIKPTVTATNPSSYPRQATNPYPTRIQPQKPSYPSSNQQIKKEVPKKQEKYPSYNPSEYGGYDDQIPQHLKDEIYGRSNTGGLNEEDEQLQRVLMQSMNQNYARKAVQHKNIPKQLSSQELMNSSFAMDFNMEQQKAAYQQMQRNARKNNRR